MRVKGLGQSWIDPFLSSLGLCTTNVAFLREPRRFSTDTRWSQKIAAVAGLIPLVAAVRPLRDLCGLCVN